MNTIKKAIGIPLILVLLQSLPASVAYADYGWYWNCNRERLVDFWGEAIEGNELSGRGLVCATPLGMWSTLSVRGLTAGNAYTVWWVYIDKPDECAATPLPSPEVIPFPEPAGYAGRCGLADFFTPSASGDFLDPLAVFGRMDSVIAGNERRTRFAGDMRSFQPSPGSQVWLFVFGHGPADQSDKRQLARQLLTPEDPASGVPHVGIDGRPFGYPAAVVVMTMP